DGEVDAGAALADAGGREVDRHPLLRPLQPAGDPRGADAVARLAAGRVGQADNGEARKPGRDVHLDGDRLAVDAEQGRRRDGGDHGALLGWRPEEGRAAGHSSAAAKRYRGATTGTPATLRSP